MKPVDLLVLADRVLTPEVLADPASSEPGFVAVRDGRIVAVGAGHEAAAWADGAARVVDLGAGTLASGFIAVTLVVRRGTGKSVVAPHLYSRGFSEDPKALEPAALKVQEALEALAAEKVTDTTRIAQAARRAVGKWVGEVYRRQPMIVPTVLEID